MNKLLKLVPHIPGFILFLLKNMFHEFYYQLQVYEFKARNPTVRIGKHVIIKNIKGLKVGENVVIEDHSYIHCGGMEWCNYEGGIEIGNNVNIGNGTLIWGTGAKVYIHDNVTFAQGVHIYASTEYREDSNDAKALRQWYNFADVIIENGAGIYSKATITPGVRIGSSARIAANSVVMKDVAPFTLVSGNPARFVKTISPVDEAINPFNA